ncbi:MAG TPA: hypothetical protein DCS42_04130 [Nitrospiraceae bacterium]|nr:hypothetical protein [Nitrospiraceae bacterium]
MKRISQKIYIGAMMAAAIFALSSAAVPAQASPAQQIIVAKSGGDYTTISAALAAITPTASTPYVIDVMPGVYVESVYLKSYVHLRGGGRDVTVIQAPSTGYYVMRAYSVGGVTISGFTIKGGYAGIYNYSSTLVVENNTIRENGFGINNNNTAFSIIRNNVIEYNTNDGITNYQASPMIEDNIIYRNTYNGIYNAYSYQSGSASFYGLIKGNKIILNGRSGIVTWLGSSPSIIGNTLSRNDIGINVSVNGTTLSTSPIIEHNEITQSWTTDIYVYSGYPYIYFNVVESITGTGGRRAYNIL